MTPRESEPQSHDDAAQPFSGWAVEYSALEVLGIDREQPAPTAVMLACCGILGGIALRPDETQIVITWDFVRSVVDRMPDSPLRDAFTLDRGAGTVTGKTMNVNGQFHVLLPARLFIDTAWAHQNLSADDAAQVATEEEGRDAFVKRTVIHEAQHVVMGQADEDDGLFPHEPWARRNFLTIAHSLISEYRAELCVPAEIRDPSDATFPVANLEVLRENLRRIAKIEYQTHLDAGRLANDVLEETKHAWTALSYLAAARKARGIDGSTLFSPEAITTEAWSLMAAGHWHRFEALLSLVPSAGVRVDTVDLEDWTKSLADLLFDWLRSYGFAFLDNDDGSTFLIESWHLLT